MSALKNLSIFYCDRGAEQRGLAISIGSLP